MPKGIPASSAPPENQAAALAPEEIAGLKQMQSQFGEVLQTVGSLKGAIEQLSRLNAPPPPRQAEPQPNKWDALSIFEEGEVPVLDGEGKDTGKKVKQPVGIHPKFVPTIQEGFKQVDQLGDRFNLLLQESARLNNEVTAERFMRAAKMEDAEFEQFVDWAGKSNFLQNISNDPNQPYYRLDRNSLTSAYQNYMQQRGHEALRKGNVVDYNKYIESTLPQEMRGRLKMELAPPPPGFGNQGQFDTNAIIAEASTQDGYSKAMSDPAKRAILEKIIPIPKLY
jgi:hypothetical protein